MRVEARSDGRVPPRSAPYWARYTSVGWEMQTEDELRTEAKEIGKDEFRKKYGRLGQTSLSHHTVNAVKAILADFDREDEEARHDELVERADQANRIATKATDVSREANRVAVAAFILAAIALALSLGLFF